MPVGAWRFGGAWLLAAVLWLFGGWLLVADVEPSSDPNVAPWWVVRVTGAILVLVASAMVLPARQAVLAFSAVFVIAALASAFLPFRPGELRSTLEIFTPFGYIARRLGDSPTRIISALIALFVIGAVATAIPQALKDEFGEQRWLSAIQGVGLLIIVPFLFGLIALLAVVASPILIWRFFEHRRELRAAGERSVGQ